RLRRGSASGPTAPADSTAPPQRRWTRDRNRRTYGTEPANAGIAKRVKGTPPPVPEGADAVAPGSGGQVGCFFVGMHNPEGAGEREPFGLAVADGCGVATLVPHSDGKPCSPGSGA